MLSDDDDDLRTLDEEFGELKKVWKLQENLFGQVSGWDDDTEGIEEETNPKESPEKEILWAAENGDLDSLRRLLSSNAQLVHVTDKDGYTPLHRACYNDHVEAVDLLLQHEANVSARTEDHWQPLHSACRWNNHRSAAKLLAHGADINAASKGGQTPLHLAASNSQAAETLKLLLSNPQINTTATNRSNETAKDIARRSGRLYTLFETVDPCAIVI